MLVLLLVTAVASFRIGGCASEPRTVEVVRPDTVYAERQLTVRDTIHVRQPYRVTVFDTVHTLRVDTIRVPVSFDYTGIIGSNPVTMEGRALTVTSFDLGKQAFVQRTYDVPERQWRLGLYSYGMVTNAYSSIGLELRVQYRRLWLAPLAQLDQQDGLTMAYGVRAGYRVF